MLNPKELLALVSKNLVLRAVSSQEEFECESKQRKNGDAYPIAALQLCLPEGSQHACGESYVNEQATVIDERLIPLLQKQISAHYQFVVKDYLKKLRQILQYSITIQKSHYSLDHDGPFFLLLEDDFIHAHCAYSIEEEGPYVLGKSGKHNLSQTRLVETFYLSAADKCVIWSQVAPHCLENSFEVRRDEMDRIVSLMADRLIEQYEQSLRQALSLPSSGSQSLFKAPSSSVTSEEQALLGCSLL